MPSATGPFQAKGDPGSLSGMNPGGCGIPRVDNLYESASGDIGLNEPYPPEYQHADTPMNEDQDALHRASHGIRHRRLRKRAGAREIRHQDVTFSRPDIETLRREGYLPVDMHFHTVHSDGLVTVPALLAGTRHRGMGCAVTDHNEISGAVQASREGGDRLVIPGIEVSASDGPHILVYFSRAQDLADFFGRHVRDRRSDSPWLMTRLTTGEILDAAGGYDCLRVPAHPYGYLVFNGGLGKCVDKGYLDRELYAQCEAIEGICGNMNHAENLQALALALRLDLPVTGGSDGHVLPDLGTAITCARAETPGDFLEELRKGRARVIGREKPLPSRIRTAAVISARFAPWFYPSLKIHCAGAGKRIRRYMGKRHREKDLAR